MEADQTILRLLDEEIARLQTARDEIASRLGYRPNGSFKTADKTTPKRVNRKGKTREEQLIEFLKLNGPSQPKEILDGTGMPRGSFGYTMTRLSEKVERLEDGRIALRR